MIESAPQVGFLSLQVRDWRQFESVDLNFHPQLTILTGANASGKSTLLTLLGKHFNWSRAWSSAPLFQAGLQGWTNLSETWMRTPNSDLHTIGELVYGSGSTATLMVPTGAGQQREQYEVLINGQQVVPGLYLTSHRSAPGNYTPISTIPAGFSTSSVLFEQYTNEVRSRWLGGYTGKTPQAALKEALIAAAVFGGGGNDAVETNEEAAEIWQGFQGILAAVMPRSLGFQRLRVRVPDVIVESSSGDFVLDEASGGISAIVEVAWQIFLRARDHPAFTVLIDEPENHLHPSLQKEILPSLLAAFPTLQFIVATHSPFVVTATPESAVYVLDYAERSRKVRSRVLDYVNKAASAEETLTRVLGLDSTMPAWAESRFEDIVGRYLVSNLDADRLRALRAELRSAGLVSEFNDALVIVADQVDPQEGQ